MSHAERLHSRSQSREIQLSPLQECPEPRNAPLAPEVPCVSEHLLLFKMVGSWLKKRQQSRYLVISPTLPPATFFLFSKIRTLVVKPLSSVCKALSLSGIHEWLYEKWKIFGEGKGTRNSVIGDHHAQFTGELKAVLLKLRLLMLWKRIPI